MITAPNPAALLMYVFCAVSGIFIERRFPLNSLFKRLMLIYAVGAGQLMVTIEALSCVRALTGWSLIFANAVLTATIFMASRRSVNSDRLTWSELFKRAREEVSCARRDWATFGLIIIGAGLFAAAAVVGWVMVPFNDSYHFEMPRFWLQNQTVYPFAAHNPRITTISFLSEAIELPAFIAFRNDKPVLLASMLAGALALGSIYSLARRLGASNVASICASAVSVGYLTFASSLYTTAAEMLLAGAFFGGSVIFLMDAWAPNARGRCAVIDLGCSVLLFVMACGAKNPTTLVAPFYWIYLGVASVRILRRTDEALPKRLASAVVAAGLIGLICSGVAWNYGANKMYFGEKGLPPLMKSVVSHAYSPRDIWTRVCRGIVVILYDTMWIPNAARDAYRRAEEGTIKVLGGKTSLPEDNPYYSFEATPMKGFGPLGIVFLVPALVVGCALSIQAFRSERPLRAESLNVITLTTLAIAAFFMCHLILRWQSIGMVRLMLPILVAASPLTSLLFERRLLRLAALGLMPAIAAIYFVYWSGLVSRRTGRTDGAFFKTIAKLQKDRLTVLRYQWKGQPERELLRREPHTYREVYDGVLQGLKQPCTIGFIGDENTECLYLFGDRAQNRIIPLVDASNEDHILDAPTGGCDYIVAADLFEEAKQWAEARGFEQILTCSGPQGEIVRVFERIRSN